MKSGLSLREVISREIALEIMEIYTLEESSKFNWPDDVSGDVIDRAKDRADSILKYVVMWMTQIADS